MPKQLNLEEEINAFLDEWDSLTQIAFLKETLPLLKIYDIDQHDDWVIKEVGIENTRNVRLISTVYLISRLADFQAGKLCMIKAKFKDLWKRIEKQSLLPDE